VTSLAALVAAAPGSLVLPPGDLRARVDVPEPLRLLDSTDLGGGRHVGVVEDADGGRWTVPLVADGDAVRRAIPGDGVAETVVAGLIATTRQFRSALKEVEASGVSQSWTITDDAPEPSGLEPFEPPSVFHLDGWHEEAPPRGERGITVDQTNESVVVGERAIVKWAVHLPLGGARGTQPAGARLSALLAAGFPETPRPWGLLHWVDPEHQVPGRSANVLLASVTSYLPGAQDGWDWAVDDVARAARHETPLDDTLTAPRRLGALTARMHVALAERPGVRRADDALVQRWRDRALADLDEAVHAVAGDAGARLRAQAPRIAASYDALLQCDGTPLIPVHGDYHVGQVLRTPSADPTLRWEYAVTDFDGNPVLPPEERIAPQPAALDVAGMLASLDHVGRVVNHRVEGADPDVVRAWIAAAQDGFRYEYADTLARTGHGDLLDERLLVPLRLQQEVREHLYAVRHLPHWVYVPDAALAGLLDRSP
jgi:maltokinase